MGAIIRCRTYLANRPEARKPLFGVPSALPRTGYLWMVRGRVTWRIK